MSDNKDRVYAPAMNWSAPRDEAPDFIKAKVGIKVDEFITFLKDNAKPSELRDEGEPRRTLLLRARYVGAEGQARRRRALLIGLHRRVTGRGATAPLSFLCRFSPAL
jgi:hypothetical protein